MTDRRFWRANERVADASLEGQVKVPCVHAKIYIVTEPVTDLCRSPLGLDRDKQLVAGQPFHVLEFTEVSAAGIPVGAAFGYDPWDGYVGYIAAGDLALTPPDQPSATHAVAVPLSHVYGQPDFKTPEQERLPMGACLAVIGEAGRFVELAESCFVPSQHVRPLSSLASDWVAVAEMFEHAPYLWGGNTAQGIDCSGLVQVSMQAAGRECPRDSDLQEAAFPVAEGDPRRGDLVFWKGHVGLMLDGQTLLHANAHHMGVAREPLAQAIKRIGAKEFGAVTKIARPG